MVRLYCTVISFCLTFTYCSVESSRLRVEADLVRSSLVTASQTSPDSKNGMIVLLNGEEGASGKLMLASGIFPLLTKCKDKSFTELVDAIVPQNTSMLKL